MKNDFLWNGVEYNSAEMVEYVKSIQVKKVKDLGYEPFNILCVAVNYDWNTYDGSNDLRPNMIKFSCDCRKEGEENKKINMELNYVDFLDYKNNYID